MTKRVTLVLLLASALLAAGCGRGADFISGNGLCEGYGEPQVSPYKAPWPAGTARQIAQGNCGGFSHVGPYRFSYDILMPIHSPVLAARDGSVANVIQNNADGDGCPHVNEVWVLHADGTVATYLHLTKNGALVNIGDQVTQGEQIGWSGLTGCTTGPHLHFEVKAHADDFDKKTVDSVPVTFSNIPGARDGPQQGETYTPL